MARRSKPPPRSLREIWDQIPAMKDCKGKCANSCGPIDCSSMETRLIEVRAGRRLESPRPAQTCSMLKHGRCTVYSIRPVICRLWGVVESMQCPHGCRPERVMGDREGYALMMEAFRIAGDDPEGRRRAAIEAMPDSVFAAMKEWVSGAPDLGGAVRHRNKSGREFVDALRLGG